LLLLYQSSLSALAHEIVPTLDMSLRGHLRVWRFRFNLWRMHRRIARQLGIPRWTGFSDEEIDVIIREVRRARRIKDAKATVDDGLVERGDGDASA
jgi:hypothetical protein